MITPSHLLTFSQGYDCGPMMKKGDDFPPLRLHHHLAGKRIIVAGAGISGLSFAVAFRRNWQASFSPSLPPPSIVIYERESKETTVARSGYSMTIRSDGFSGGMQSTEKMGLLDKVVAASATGTQGGKFIIWDPSMKPLVEFQLAGADRRNKKFPVPALRIARSDLRRVLIDGLAAQDEVRWTVSCTGAEGCPGDGGKVKVQLSNGSVDECDLLIAADGARSKLRGALRPEDGLRFTGAVTLGGTARFTEGKGVEGWANRDWGFVIGGTGKGMFMAPVNQHSASWSVSYITEKPRALMRPPYTQDQVDAMLKEALETGEGSSKLLKTMVALTDPDTLTLSNAMERDPFKHREGERVIFIGDANHAMCQFAGNGANMALMDGCDLAEQLCKASTLVAAVEAYDELSMPRSKTAVWMSQGSILLAHATGWKLKIYMVLMKFASWFV